MRKLIAIVDTLANDILGPVQLHHRDETAIRTFSDIATMPNSQIGMHIKDYHLVCLGELNEELNIIAEYRVIMTGEQLESALQPKKMDL